jgi:hypothetical protein
MPQVNFVADVDLYSDLRDLNDAIRSHCKQLHSPRELTPAQLARANLIGRQRNMTAANEYLHNLQYPLKGKMLDAHPLSRMPDLIQHLLRSALDSLGPDQDSRLAALLGSPTEDPNG